MNGSYNSDRNLDEFDESKEPEREISLGTSTVLGIFFALALVCSLFFGFGYTMGRRSAPSVAGVQESAAVAASSGSKPLSGSAESHPAAGTAANDSTSAAEGSAASVAPAPAEVAKQSVVASDAQPSSAAAASVKAPVRVVQAPVAASPAVSSAVGSFVVQIAAVSHREDADILVTTLSRRGYNVTIRQEPQDKLLHVQIGPFANKKEADGMRQRLLADGYNAIVK